MSESFDNVFLLKCFNLDNFMSHIEASRLQNSFDYTERIFCNTCTKNILCLKAFPFWFLTHKFM